MGKVSYHYDIKCHLDYDSVLVCGKVALNAMKPNGYAYSSSWARNMMSDIENPYRKEV